MSPRCVPSRQHCRAAGRAQGAVRAAGRRTYLIINATIFAAFAILALSLALIWGYAGILQWITFFDLGGYTYAVKSRHQFRRNGGSALAVAAISPAP